MAPPETEYMDRARIETAFDLLGRKAAAQGIAAEIAVFGGSAIALASDLRTSTGDVDAVFMRARDFLYEAAAEVRKELFLPRDWLNEAVSRTARMANSGYEDHVDLFKEYPVSPGSAVGLRVFVANPNYLLAMKLLANRGDFEEGKARQDIEDIRGLMRVTGRESETALVEILRECYSNVPGITEPKLAFRIKAKIADVLEGYEPHGDRPAWNAG